MPRLHRFMFATLVATLFLSVHANAMSFLRADSPRYYQAPPSSWALFKQQFIDNGRVIDTGNKGISHTEGQGWAILIAEHHGDRATFDELWTWTRAHRQLHHSGLLSWRYDPSQTPRVSDLNNASYGDIFIAWALLRAGTRWHDERYVQEGLALRTRIADQLVRQVSGYTVILPGREGFERPDGVIVNLSYWVMPAFNDFATVDPDGPWQTLSRDGQRLLAVAGMGPHRLPPDWIHLNNKGELTAAEDWPPRFGFEGVRIPLYYSWAGKRNAKELGHIRQFWQTSQPAWINITTGEEASYPLSAGGLAIRQLLNGNFKNASPTLTPRQDYYAASLLILSQIAEAESPAR